MVTPDRKRLIEQLLAQHGRRVLAYIRRWSRGAAADDILQEAFARLWQLPADALLENPVAWLYTVCRRLCIDAARRDARVDHVEPERIARHQDSVAADIADHIGEDMDQTHAVERLLGGLSVQQQEAVRLKFLHDRSYKEIAQIMDLTVSHVGVILHQALKKIRAVQSEQGAVCQ